MKTEDGRVLHRDLLKTRESYIPRETSDFYDHDKNTSSSKKPPQAQAAGNVASLSQAANSEAIRPCYTISGSEVCPPKRFQDYTK